MNKIKIGDYIETITDYHANGAYEKLKENVELKSEKDYAVMIRTLNFEQNDFKDNLIYIDEAAYNYLAKSKVQTNDILMNKIANPGSVYIMPEFEGPVSCGMNLFLIRFNEKVDQRYMYYNMKHNEAYIKSLAHGTTTKTITKDEVRNIELFVHDSKEQKRIADFLQNIDKKIRLLEKNIDDCHEYISKLYNYYIIQKGKDTKKVKLKTFLEFERGVEVGADNYSSFNDGTLVKFYRVSDMLGNCETYTKKELANGKYICSDDIGVSFDGTVGKVTYGIEGIYSTGIRKIISKDGRLSNAVIYAIFTSEEIQLTIQRHATGSNILHASEAINHLEIPFDDKNINILNDAILPVFEQMKINKKEITRLQNLKKKMISLLMNGQVRLKK